MAPCARTFNGASHAAAKCAGRVGVTSRGHVVIVPPGVLSPCSAGVNLYARIRGVVLNLPGARPSRDRLAYLGTRGYCVEVSLSLYLTINVTLQHEDIMYENMHILVGSGFSDGLEC